MRGSATIFLSYSTEDSALATALEAALKSRQIQVWRDVRNLAAGVRWSGEIEAGIRGSRGVVVLITEASANSAWVLYEYAFAIGAGIPVVAVVKEGEIPAPMQQFQIVNYTSALAVAKRIESGLSAQSRAEGQKRAAKPALLAKIREYNGEPILASGGKTPAICMDLWLEQVPKDTMSVKFEIPDESFRDRKWTVRRLKRFAGFRRDFLTEDFNTYGDVEIWARGIGRGAGNWSGSWRLYEALVAYYRSRETDAALRKLLKQIRNN